MTSKLLRVKLPSNLMEFYMREYDKNTLRETVKAWRKRYHHGWCESGANRLLAIGICQKYGVPFDTSR